MWLIIWSRFLSGSTVGKTKKRRHMGKEMRANKHERHIHKKSKFFSLFPLYNGVFVYFHLLSFFLSFYLFRPWTCIVKTDATYSSISFAIVLLRILHYHRHPVVISHQFLHLTIPLCIVQKQRNTGERKWPCIFPATIESKFNKCLLFHLFHFFFSRWPHVAATLLSAAFPQLLPGGINILLPLKKSLDAVRKCQRLSDKANLSWVWTADFWMLLSGPCGCVWVLGDNKLVQHEKHLRSHSSDWKEGLGCTTTIPAWIGGFIYRRSSGSMSSTYDFSRLQQHLP